MCLAVFSVNFQPCNSQHYFKNNKYQSPSKYYINDIHMVQVSNMQVKHQGQGHKLKSVSTLGKVLFEKTIKVLVHTIHSI
jgi:hypothetical protein